MTTENNTPETEATPETKPAAANGWGKWVAVGAVAAMLVGGAGVASAISDDSGRNFKRLGFEHSESMGGRDGGMMQARWGGGGGHGRGMGRVLQQLDLTDEQEDKIFEIMDGVRGEVRPLMREFRDTRENLVEILSAETIDRQAIETLRTERLASVDQASKTMSEALLNAAEVLTPEQRAELAKLIEDHGMGGRHGRW